MIKYILFVFLIVLLSYVLYVVFSSKRLKDNQIINIENNNLAIDNNVFSIITYNIGMGIYSKDFSFFMDKGKYSKAFSKQEVIKNTNGVVETIKKYNVDFICLEETSIKSNCNYKINQLEILKKAFNDYACAFAQNWNSPYFVYPLTKPFGKAIAGLTFLSKYKIVQSIRRCLPLEKSLTSMIDLDRCYLKNTLDIDGNKKLVIFVIHPSAYTSNQNITSKQIELLIDDMSNEYKKGNYVIAAGDYNRDLYGESNKLFGVPTKDIAWMNPLNKELIPNYFNIVTGLDINNPIPSARNADSPYNKDNQAQVIIDGYIVSNNIQVVEAEIINTEFEYSDHNPVLMKFSLK